MQIVHLSVESFFSKIDALLCGAGPNLSLAIAHAVIQARSLHYATKQITDNTPYALFLYIYPAQEIILPENTNWTLFCS